MDTIKFTINWANKGILFLYNKESIKQILLLYWNIFIYQKNGYRTKVYTLYIWLQTESNISNNLSIN